MRMSRPTGSRTSRPRQGASRIPLAEVEDGSSPSI